MKRPKCVVCGATEGPAIYAADEQCSVNCKKYASGEYTESQYIIFSGKSFNTATGYFDLKIEKVANPRFKKNQKRGRVNDLSL